MELLRARSRIGVKLSWRIKKEVRFQKRNGLARDPDYDVSTFLDGSFCPSIKGLFNTLSRRLFSFFSWTGCFLFIPWQLAHSSLRLLLRFAYWYFSMLYAVLWNCVEPDYFITNYLWNCFG